jgi:hypothetical protein
MHIDTAQESLMDETYRMLGREHDLNLEREAGRRRLASQLPSGPRPRRLSALTVAADRFRRLLLELRGRPAAPPAHARRR